ncbi:MAG TPA: alpha-2-macroglobulin family protein [Verrucomicrobiae bacterium]|nr:alpha-2-macroglobulin family protein [Verrucomicrobiae bacterium]
MGPLLQGIVLCGLLANMDLHVMAGSRDDQWKAVEDARNKGLPRTAITNLESIISAALEEKQYPEFVKAFGEKIALEGLIEGSKPEEKITRLQTAMKTAPAETLPVFETLLAHWYWQYYMQNRWRFLQRTTTASAPGADFTTWDLPRIFAEIDLHFQRALSAERQLKALPIQSWDALLQRGTMPDEYRPTLYDFIAHEALEFYTAGEQAGAAPEDDFELEASSPALGSVDDFLHWHPKFGVNSNSPPARAIGLYQELLRFHQHDERPEFAFANADLERLRWAWNTSMGEDKNARYKAALDRFIGRFRQAAIGAMALYQKAELLRGEEDFVGAHEAAREGRMAHPDSPGGKLCANVIHEIEAKSVEIQTERVWNAPWPDINVNYRNVRKVYFRAIRLDWGTLLEKRRYRPGDFNEKELREIISQPAALEWSENLPPTTDYKPRTSALKAPSGLKPGFYIIAASNDPGFGEKNNVVSTAGVWVSNLSLITRQRAGRIEGFVLDAISGEPVQAAEVTVWRRDPSGVRTQDTTLTSDADGFFSLQPRKNTSYIFRVRHDGFEVATENDLWSYGWDGGENDRPGAATVFFTDRAIYRPGQMIQYKGICIWADRERNEYEALHGEKVTVVFRDVNGKEIARQDRQANDFGSFSGSFTAPRDRLLGEMSLAAEGRAQGGAPVRVEEYKRPKFEVKLDAPGTAPRLNDKVSLKGHAISYTGAAVDSARVTFRIVRQVRLPWWCIWYGGPVLQRESQEIAHGSLQTGVDGAFTIEFTARPDPRIPESNEPIFSYEIHADVTDNVGETRSDDRTVRVGYAALEARLSADDWQVARKPLEVTVQTSSLDGEPQPAEGKVRVYELQAPERVRRGPLSPVPIFWRGGIPGEDGSGPAGMHDLSNPNSWPLGRMTSEQTFITDAHGRAKLSFKLKAGAYRAVLETQDRFGKRVTEKLPLEVLEPGQKHFPIKIPNLLAAPHWDAQPGGQFTALWGTGYKEGRALVEIEHRHKIVRRFWTRAGATQQEIKIAVSEAMRGGFLLHVMQVRENRAYLSSRRIDVPWANKELEINWEHFVSKLKPGQKETWTAVIKKKNGRAGKVHEKSSERWAAEMAATLYDESLDAFDRLNWPNLNVFYEDQSWFQEQFCNTVQRFREVYGSWAVKTISVTISYRSFPFELSGAVYGYRGRGIYARRLAGPGMLAEEPQSAGGVSMEKAAVASATPMALNAAETKDSTARGPAPETPPHSKRAEPPPISARRNLNETAFFFPQLTTDSNGVVRITFSMPEALTRWRFLGFAHDRSLRSGLLEAQCVTSKELMVQPNPPRFLREGDTLEFTVKVSNQSPESQNGTVRLDFSNALTGESADALLGNVKPELNFSIPAKESRGFSWRIHVPDGCGFLTYKAIAAGHNVSDGEEGAIPVLSRRILVTESMTLPIRGPATKTFEFTNLLKAATSKSLESKSFTVQMVSNPAWYAVLALPYLMEYPYECSEQVFNRLYANALARHIAASDSKIHRVFELWRNTPALESPLEKNPDLKSVALEETPWVRQAESESQARKNIGALFDANRMDAEMARAMSKLKAAQLPEGGWAWFPGGRRDEYITLYIVAGFGRMRHLGLDVDLSSAVRALRGLDGWMKERYDKIQKQSAPDDYVPGPIDALYLYARSFFLKDASVQKRDEESVNFFLRQSRKFWLKTGNRQTQAHIALALHRFDSNDAVPEQIVNSLRERSVSNEEMGMFWRDTELSWWWYRAPIETQALMIEAFDEIAHDAKAVEDCQVWLLKQKQTQNWSSTKATADAVYALLLRGRNPLAGSTLAEVKLGALSLTPASPSQAEPGTGFYERRFASSEIKPEFGRITVTKRDPGAAWGSVNWQYLEDIGKVTANEGVPLQLKKTLFKKINSKRGQVLEPVTAPLRIGDELVVRIELRADRDMEYTHLEDQRGSGLEPLDTLSGWRYQDGLAYYESTRDTASHFFIAYLPKGVYVFEYGARVVHAGDYQSGIAKIQCLYAPEFNSHSQSFEIRAR